MPVFGILNPFISDFTANVVQKYARIFLQMRNFGFLGQNFIPGFLKKWTTRGPRSASRTTRVLFAGTLEIMVPSAERRYNGASRAEEDTHKRKVRNAEEDNRQV